MCTERNIDPSSTDLDFQRMFEKYEAYQLSLKRQRDWNSIINTAREEGREEGRKRQKMHIAQLMKQDGEPISKIIRFTGLAEQEISEL